MNRHVANEEEHKEWDEKGRKFKTDWGRLKKQKVIKSTAREKEKRDGSYQQLCSNGATRHTAAAMSHLLQRLLQTDRGPSWPKLLHSLTPQLSWMFLPEGGSLLSIDIPAESPSKLILDGNSEKTIGLVNYQSYFMFTEISAHKWLYLWWCMQERNSILNHCQVASLED